MVEECNSLDDFDPDYSIVVILINIKNLIPYLLLIAVYFFFVNLEARKSQLTNEEYYNKANNDNETNNTNSLIKKNNNINIVNDTDSSKKKERKHLYKHTKNNKLSSLNFILVFIISFAALIVLLDTFKNPISLILPNIEFILQSLYETLRDITLFVQDLF